MERKVKFYQPRIIRATHWLNAVLLLGMIASGLQIFHAYPAFAERGGTFCCYPFAGYRFPEVVRLGGWLAGGLRWNPKTDSDRCILAQRVSSGDRETIQIIQDGRQIDPCVDVRAITDLH